MITGISEPRFIFCISSLFVILLALGIREIRAYRNKKREDKWHDYLNGLE